MKETLQERQQDRMELKISELQNAKGIWKENQTKKKKKKKIMHFNMTIICNKATLVEIAR